jgi:hypothetical protein
LSELRNPHIRILRRDRHRRISGRLIFKNNTSEHVMNSSLSSQPRVSESFVTRLRRRYHKQRADHVLQQAIRQRQYYRDNELQDALGSNVGKEHERAIFSLRTAKRSFSRGEINHTQLNAVREELRSAIGRLHDLGDDHRMRFTEAMQDFVIPQFANNVQSFVYAGAGLLVMIVGLRGLGDLRPIGIVPAILLDADGMLRGGIVFAALCLELFLLLLLAILFFFTPDEQKKSNGKETIPSVGEELTANRSLPKGLEGVTREALQALVEKKVEEIRMIERIKSML